ncbi:Probable transmembrane ascorbate ferrireductase 3 [Linum grandiflorum]
METAVYRRSASGLTVGAHVFGILGIILMLVWLLHFREGIEYDSDNPARVFNVHPFLMFCGFIFLVGQDHHSKCRLFQIRGSIHPLPYKICLWVEVEK